MKGLKGSVFKLTNASSCRRCLSSSTIKPKILQCQREMFDMPPDIHYFNTSYLSPGLKCVIEAGKRGVNRKAEPWKIFANDFFEESQEYRRLVFDMISFSYGYVVGRLTVLITLIYLPLFIWLFLYKKIIQKLKKRFFNSDKDKVLDT